MKVDDLLNLQIFDRDRKRVYGIDECSIVPNGGILQINLPVDEVSQDVPQSDSMGIKMSCKQLFVCTASNSSTAKNTVKNRVYVDDVDCVIVDVYGAHFGKSRGFGYEPVYYNGERVYLTDDFLLLEVN